MSLYMAPKNEETYVGLDIGTSKVVCVVGLHQQDSPTPSIIGLGVSPTSGLRRGVVVDVEETVSSITAALEEAERMSGIAIERATISIDGSQIRSMNSKGVIAVSRADREITKEELVRVEQAATAVQLDSNRQIIEVIANSYTVDGQSGISDPVGMNGIKLEVETHIISGSTPAIKNLDNAVFRSGVKINNQQIVPIAAAKTVLTKKQMELGVAMVNFGSETTGLVIYREGKLVYSSILPIGSNNITKDLVYGLKTNIEIAEKIKIKHGEAKTPNPRDTKKIDLNSFGGSGIFSQNDIDKIIYSRCREIFTLVSKEISKVDHSRQLAAGIVLTGGGANLENLVEFVKDIAKLPVSIGSSQKYTGVSDKISDPSYSVAIGLMLEDMEIPRDQKNNKFEAVIGGIGQKIKSVFKSILP
jgi:cell division protein FtsA